MNDKIETIDVAIEVLDNFLDELDELYGVSTFNYGDNVFDALDFIRQRQIENFQNKKTHDAKMRKHIIKNQFSIPRKLEYLVFKYPNVTWYHANELYSKAVEEVLNKFNVECILDAGGFGQGYQEAAVRFINKLEEEVVQM